MFTKDRVSWFNCNWIGQGTPNAFPIFGIPSDVELKNFRCFRGLIPKHLWARNAQKLWESSLRWNRISIFLYQGAVMKSLTATPHRPNAMVLSSVEIIMKLTNLNAFVIKVIFNSWWAAVGEEKRMRPSFPRLPVKKHGCFLKIRLVVGQ